MSRPRVRTVITGAVLVASLALVGGAPAAAAPGCDDLLVVHRPDGSDGQVAAVAITSQVLDASVAVWAAVGWEAAANTTLRAVLVVGEDAVRTLPGTATGTAEGALELRFCGEQATELEDAAVPAPDGGQGRATTTAVVDVGAAAGWRDAALVGERTGSATPAAQRTGTGPVAIPGMLGAAAGLFVGVVVLLLSRHTRRERVRP